MSSKQNNKSEDIWLDKIIDSTFDKLKNIVDANTTIGSTIKLSDKMFVIPISRINVGLVSGGGDFSKSKKNSGMSAGSTTGFSVTPIGFITVANNSIDFINASQENATTNKVLEMLLNLSEKLISKEGGSNEKN